MEASKNDSRNYGNEAKLEEAFSHATKAIVDKVQEYFQKT